jgi:signal transduction histidine kinase
MTLYRAAQEGLTNVQKHAQARRATVTLHSDSTCVSLIVENDGVANVLTGDGGGFGLAGLRERAEQLGGRLASGALPDGGFRLQLTLPVDKG